MSVSEWLKNRDACTDGYKWAVTNCATMQEVWDTAKPEWLIWVATRQGVLDDITLRRFACYCVRQVWHLLTDERSRNAVEVADAFCDGKATKEELDAARAAAWAAAWDARDARDARAAWAATRAAAGDAGDAAWDAAGDAGDARGARDAAWAAAGDAAGDAARAAAWAAARDAARDAAGDAAGAVQAAWLRGNCKPNFDN